jgi:hypothetical protein
MYIKIHPTTTENKSASIIITNQLVLLKGITRSYCENNTKKYDVGKNSKFPSIKEFLRMINLQLIIPSMY